MNKQHTTDRAALGWFALGALVGAGALAAVLALTGMLESNPSAGDLAAIQAAAKAGAQEALREGGSVDLSAVREAAREAAKAGVEEALQAGADKADQAPAGDPEAIKNAAPRGSNMIGNPQAVVTIIEYSDYQCPYCLRFHTTIFPELVRQYVDTGKVRYSFKHFPFLTPESAIAAQAAECAADQQRFWEYHNLLYAERERTGRLEGSKDKFIEYAGTLKLDTQAFSACLNEDRTLSRVQQDALEGQKVGVRGTPSFLINGKLVVGAQPLIAFQTAIEEALKAAGQ
ncbi:MAG: thioredoxin domain-containing protein [Anaerolineae bacterium]|nr:DsbA family protein [Thermoflexales bacterium]MDW8408401.1 thioredoxin domain-containing protein [Anaerolineae bacterium]